MESALEEHRVPKLHIELRQRKPDGDLVAGD
jgi:hypothetical protein